jgi:hypothetical protein
MKRKPRERKQPERWVDQARGFPWRAAWDWAAAGGPASSADLPSKARPDLHLPASERRAREREIARKTETDPKKSRTGRGESRGDVCKSRQGRWRACIAAWASPAPASSAPQPSPTCAPVATADRALPAGQRPCRHSRRWRSTSQSVPRRS